MISSLTEHTRKCLKDDTECILKQTEGAEGFHLHVGSLVANEAKAGRLAQHGVLAGLA